MLHNLDKIILFHRKKSGFSREKLGKLAGIGKTTIYDIEHGKQGVQFSSLLKLLDILNIHIKLESPLMSQCMGVIDEKS